ncbi:helix-turn-helix domain-containing protein [Thermostaphylospora chromogena]|uniref:Homeodomain-like domain-containing protein n=1 Tax=Thermostaphylospora chromogena TaxID=35622 RepID=A0A1H1FWA1_9ACTN|nr:Homeodomain-like domain-containing protein [Thermostaphylospora chromogena]
MANERLRAALLEKGVSVTELAEAIGVDPKTVERWITKGRALSRLSGRTTTTRSV